MATDYQKNVYFTRHGGAYDRGSADSYYGRGKSPHYYEGDSYTSKRIVLDDPNHEFYKAYMQGYEDNEKLGDKKDWGIW